MKVIQDALARVGKSLAEGLQELNQKLARQRAIGGTKNIQASKVPTFTGCQSYRFEVLVSNEFDEDAGKDLKKSYLMRVLSEEIDKQLEDE